MQFRQLGDSDLKVSTISLGSWLTYGLGVDGNAGESCVAAAFDAGINFIDTANIYGKGAAESFLGDVLQGRPRDSYVLATKLFAPMTEEDKGLSAAQIYKQIDLSLARLKTDYVDLYQCHRYDPETPLEETMEALTEVVKQGKARYIGFSEWSPQQIQDSLDIKGVKKFVSSQPQYSMLWRRPEEKVIPLCAANGISQIVWSPLGQGVLTGKYMPGQPPAAGTRATSDEMGGFMESLMREDILTAVQKLKPLADEAGATLGQFALAWVLREPNVASAIIGASKPEQVIENAAAADLKIDSALFKKADQILASVLQKA